jgi:hypothetical protein
MDKKKYIFAFLITVAIFGTAIYVSNYIGNKRLDDVRTVESQISLDILSSETQTALLEETACSDINNNYLSEQLGALGDKLSYAASQNSPDNSDIENLKEYYSLLEIKDYLLMKKITTKCGVHPTFILYFYSDASKCPDCEKTGFVLDALRQKYPSIRIYSFDYNINQAAVKTLISIYHINGNLPAMIINGDPYYGFRSLDELESTIPAIKRLKSALEASSTPQ